MSDLIVYHKAFYPERLPSSSIGDNDADKESVGRLIKEGADIIRDPWGNNYVDNGSIVYSKGKNQKDNHGKMDDIVFGIHDNKILYCDKKQWGQSRLK